MAHMVQGIDTGSNNLYLHPPTIIWLKTPWQFAPEPQAFLYTLTRFCYDFGGILNNFLADLV